MRLAALTLLLGPLGGCDAFRTSYSPREQPLDTAPVDDDGDSYLSDEDCNDLDPAINPGAIETCDGIDNDCDGLVDEEVTDTYYADLDGDGYGDPAAPMVTCDQPLGMVPNANDCDDGDAGVHPGGEEVCDGIDQDCDGDVDEGVMGTGEACPAVDCAAVLADQPEAEDGDYWLETGRYTCDMRTDGGGWTRLGEGLALSAGGYDDAWINTEGLPWSQALFVPTWGQVPGECAYPDDLPDCNPVAFQPGQEDWSTALNGQADPCGVVGARYDDATRYLDGGAFVIARAASTDALRVGTVQGVGGCEPGEVETVATLDLYLRP